MSQKIIFRILGLAWVLTWGSLGWCDAAPASPTWGLHSSSKFELPPPGARHWACVEAERPRYGAAAGAESFLWYVSAFKTRPDDLSCLLRIAQERRGSLQLAFEPSGHSLARLADGFEDSNSVLHQRAREWAEALARSRVPIELRPMSEMNLVLGSGDRVALWQLQHEANRAAGAPEQVDRDFARAWNGLHEIFHRAGARNVRFHFNVSAFPYKPAMAARIRGILGQIDDGRIDALGVHPFARAQPGDASARASGFTAPTGGGLISFRDLVSPWIQSAFAPFPDGRHARARLAIGEMGVSGNPLARGEFIDAGGAARSKLDGHPFDTALAALKQEIAMAIALDGFTQSAATRQLRERLEARGVFGWYSDPDFWVNTERRCRLSAQPRTCEANVSGAHQLWDAERARWLADALKTIREVNAAAAADAPSTPPVARPFSLVTYLDVRSSVWALGNLAFPPAPTPPDAPASPTN